MLKIGLTGNLGSGKSLVANIFQILKVPVYNADAVSRAFLSGKPVQDLIRSSFGDGVFSNATEINRKALARIVFSDPVELSRLNIIMHPLVKEDFRRWCNSHNKNPYIIQEAAIIYESGLMDEYDRIIHVSCPEEMTVERAMHRDDATREEVLMRIRFQWRDERKAALSDYIILNDGSELVIPQVLKIHELLLKSSMMV
jgi:dephospho-CoA kinase